MVVFSVPEQCSAVDTTYPVGPAGLLQAGPSAWLGLQCLQSAGSPGSAVSAVSAGSAGSAGCSGSAGSAGSAVSASVARLLPLWRLT